MFTNHRPFLLRALGLALVVAFAAPAAHAADGDERAKFKDRAQRFWNSRVQDDWAVVYDLMSVEEQQLAGNDREKFAEWSKKKGWFKYNSVKFGEFYVDKDLAWVEVTFSTSLRQYPTMPAQESTLWDVWRKTDDWRQIPRQAADQFPTRPPQVRPAEEESAVAKRVDAMWEARKSQDWAAVYELLDPTYRASVTKEDFLKRKSKYLYLSHVTEWVEVSGVRGRSKVSFVQKLNDPTLHKLQPTNETAFEAWVKVDGQWFRQMPAENRGAPAGESK
jgi:hypothetical protein